MNLQSSTLKFDETGEPFHIQQAAQIRAFRAAWKEAGHSRTPRISVSRSIFALIDDRDRAYFGRGGQEQDKVGFIDGNRQAVFGRGYAAEPDALVEELMVGNPARRYSSLSTIAGSTFIARRIGCQAARMPMAPTVSRAPAKDKGSNGLMP